MQKKKKKLKQTDTATYENTMTKGIYLGMQLI